MVHSFLFHFKPFVSLDPREEDQGSVNCGHHRAPKCEQCTLGNVRSWCAGECHWDDSTNSCIGWYKF